LELFAFLISGDVCRWGGRNYRLTRYSFWFALALKIAVCLLWGGGATAFAHHREDTVWTARYNGGGDDFPKALAIDRFGNLYVAAYSAGGGSGFDILTLKYNPQGETLWTRRFNGAGNGDDFAAGLAVDSSGNVYVTGQSYGGPVPGFDIVTLKYSPTGALLYQAVYADSGATLEEPRALALDPGGNLYVTGTGSNDAVVIKYAPGGNTLWARRFGTAAFDLASALAFDGLGNVYVGGTIRAGSPGADFALVKFTPAGDSLWSRTYNGPGSSSDEASALLYGPAGRLYLGGSSAGAGSGSDFAVAAYDTAGGFLWDFRYNGPGNSTDFLQGLALDDSGYVYIAGQSFGTSFGYDYAALRLIPSGDSLWCRRYNGPSNLNDVASSVVVDGKGRIYVGGWSVQDGVDFDFMAFRHHPDGRELWNEHYNGAAGGNDLIRALAPDDSGFVFAVGESFGTAGNYDIALVKFAPCISMQGDLNEDGVHSSIDVILELNRVFLGTGGFTVCMADLNCDNLLTAADVVGILNVAFLGLPIPCLK
jgi:uncharacterized delta-60 repeat protein